VARGIVEIAGQHMSIDGEHAIGASLRLAVRPEKIVLARIATISPAGDGLPAQIREIVYRGATTHLYLESAAGPIIAYLQNAAGDATRWQVGDSAACSWAEGSAVVMEDQA